MMGLRLGDNPQGVVTSTPKPTKLIPRSGETTQRNTSLARTYENRANLAQGFFDYVIKKYEGTRLGLQELEAKLLTDNPGALWKREHIDDHRVTTYPDLTRVGSGVDPTASAGGDEGWHCDRRNERL